MALVRTNVSTTVKAPGVATSVTTASFTPADNSLVVVFAGLQSSNNSLAASISGGSLTWTKQAQAGVDVSNFGHFSIFWTAPVTTGASMTVTVGNMPSDGTAEGVVHVFYYTGHNISAPVGGTASATVAFNSTVNLTLSSAPATTSEVIAGASDDTGAGAANITTGTGWTQQNHVSDTANTDTQSQTRTSSTSTNVLWNSNAAGTNGCAVAIEIVVAASTSNPFVSNISDLPPRGFVYSEWQKWSEPGNTQLPFRDLTKPSAKPDFPNPLPIAWYRSFETKGNALTFVPHNPFFQTDWPIPQRVTWYQSWTKSFNLTNPFRQLDWPIPKTYKPIDQFWSQSLTILYQSETFPFVQSDYPNPQRITWYRDWSQNLQETTLVPSFQAPFNQTDWPLPRTYQPIQQFWAEAGNVQLPFPTPFFQNVDFPLPVVSQPIDQTWLQNLLPFFQSNTFPFSQTDWENPLPVYWFRDYNQNLALYLPVGEKPFSQMDWPLTKAPQPIDQSFWQALVLNLPEPPPPVEQGFAGHQWTEADVKRAAAGWLNLIRWRGMPARIY